MSAKEHPDRLLLLDFPSIKSYVFGTDAAKEIRGASALLDHLNRERLPWLLGRSFSERMLDAAGSDLPAGKGRKPDSPEKQFSVISAGGGKALVAFWGVEEKEVEDFLTVYRRAVADESEGGLSIEAVHLPWVENFQKTVSALHAKEALHRFSSLAAYPRQHSGLLRMCHSCTLRPATASAKDGDDAIRICLVCQAKRSQKAHAIWKGFVEGYNAELGQDETLRVWDIRPKDFDAIAEAPQPRPGYFAVLYGDGDAMGKVIKGITTPEGYKTFSKTIDGSLREATYGVLREVFPLVWSEGSDKASDKSSDKASETGAGGSRKASGKPEPLPVDILLLGGDDLVLVVPASKALECATKIARAFQQKTKEEFSKANFFDKDAREYGMTVSFGVAIGKGKQPFFQIFEQAEALLKSAKKKRTEAEPLAQGQGGETKASLSSRREEKKAGPTLKASGSIEPWIDFADISQTRFLDIKDIRKEEYGVGSLYAMTMWPRSLSQTTALLGQVEAFQTQKFKPTRLYAWVRLLRKGGKRLTFEFYRQMTRLTDAERKLVLDYFEAEGVTAPPWRVEPADGKESFSTPLLDLLTLLRYHAKEDEGDKEDRGESHLLEEESRKARKTKEGR